MGALLIGVEEENVVELSVTIKEQEPICTVEEQEEEDNDDGSGVVIGNGQWTPDGTTVKNKIPGGT